MITRTVPTVRSILDPQALAQLISAAYDVTVEGCVLHRTLVNDLYRIDSATGRFAGKLYQHSDPTLVRRKLTWEIGLIDRLRTADPALGVPAVRRTVDGAPMIMVQAPEGPRFMIISDWLPGRKPEPPFDDDLYADFGRLIAGFHHATEDLDPSGAQVFDLEHALIQPLAALEPVLAERAEELRLVQRIGAAAHEHLLAAPPSETGIGHGDVRLDNILLTAAGMAIHDFDRAGVRWRVADLTGVAGTDHLRAFVDGYRQRRPLADDDLAALPWLRVVASIENLAFHLVDKPRLRGQESINEGWADGELTTLAELAAALGV